MKEDYFRPILIGILILAADFTSKWLTQQHLPLMSESLPVYPYGGIPVFGDFLGIEFSLSHTINRGAAWGLGADYQSWLMVLRIFLIAGLGVYLCKFNKDTRFVLPFTLILAGALGNIVDYFVYGYVIDMFHFVLWGYDFPVFNVADSSIFLGVSWLIWLSSL